MGVTARLRGALGPTPWTVAVAAGVLGLADWGAQLAGNSLLPGGPLDEVAHLLTMLLVAWAVGRRLPPRVVVAALVASVAIDVDHIPQHLGTDFLTVGTPRPYPHSLLTMVVVLILALAWARRRAVLLGVALGLLVHFGRDLADPGTGVALLWPASDASFHIPHWSYVAAMAVVVAIAAGRAWGSRLRPIGHPSTEPVSP